MFYKFKRPHTHWMDTNPDISTIVQLVCHDSVRLQGYHSQAKKAFKCVKRWNQFLCLVSWAWGCHQELEQTDPTTNSSNNFKIFWAWIHPKSWVLFPCSTCNYLIFFSGQSCGTQNRFWGWALPQISSLSFSFWQIQLSKFVQQSALKIKQTSCKFTSI